MGEWISPESANCSGWLSYWLSCAKQHGLCSSQCLAGAGRKLFLTEMCCFYNLKMTLNTVAILISQYHHYCYIPSYCINLVCRIHTITLWFQSPMDEVSTFSKQFWTSRCMASNWDTCMHKCYRTLRLKSRFSAAARYRQTSAVFWRIALSVMSRWVMEILSGTENGLKLWVRLVKVRTTSSGNEHIFLMMMMIMMMMTEDE